MQDFNKPGSINNGLSIISKEVKSGWDKYGGHICTIAGTTGLFLSGIHACRRTYRLHDELAENGRRISKAWEKQKGDKKGSAFWRATKETTKCAAKTTVRYAADILGGAASAYMINKGWQKEHTNYEQAATMVGVVMADYLNYRRNVISEQGEEADRRYMTTNSKGKIPVCIKPKNGKKNESEEKTGNGEEHILQLEENSLRILYSKETTPTVWYDSFALRKMKLEDIENRLNMDLMYGGSYTVNDVRRYFYGRKGDIGEGGMFGRIWDPGNPEHPERGAMVNLHFREDEDFMSGINDYCWITIDIDPEPLFELMSRRRSKQIEEGAL